jgi:hypothetical protein
MAKKLALVQGIPRMTEESASPTIYDETLEVVSSGAGAGEINGPISAGTPVTLPSSKTYTGNELEVWLDGDRLKPTFDYTFNSSTTVAFTFELKPGDVIRFRIDRGA